MARKLAANGIRFTKVDNVLIDVGDLDRAQAFADCLASLDWPRIMDRFTLFLTLWW